MCFRLRVCSPSGAALTGIEPTSFTGRRLVVYLGALVPLLVYGAPMKRRKKPLGLTGEGFSVLSIDNKVLFHSDDPCACLVFQRRDAAAARVYRNRDEVLIATKGHIAKADREQLLKEGTE